VIADTTQSQTFRANNQVNGGQVDGLVWLNGAKMSVVFKAQLFVLNLSSVAMA